ncbi:hypothetical protein BY458DRAFT_556698 [Sporodiniella umbellata]|nr:hypothetical protein BY458DRAFT_556698 [Sporodiniella umbellata]
MKEGFESVKIEADTNELEFIGPAKKTDSTEEKQLRGTITLLVQRAVKIKSIALKFKGRSQATYTRSTDLQKFTITARVQPKVKTKLVEKTMLLTPGQHIIPWELAIPNVYPRTLEIERCNIRYTLEVKIALGVGRSFTAECPITLYRHLVPSIPSVVKINTRCYKHTSANKLSYEIVAPRVVCTHQQSFPLALRYKSLNGLPVQHISVYLVQTEVHRVRNVTKIESDKKTEGSSLSKAIKYLGPSVYNYVNNQAVDTSDLPLLIIQQLPPKNVIHGIESPLIAIYHQLDVTFDMGQEKAQTRIPIYMSSTPGGASERAPMYEIESEAHQKPLSTQIFDSPTPKDTQPRPASPLRKCVSEHNLCRPQGVKSPTTAGSNRPLKPINTDLANRLESTHLANEPYSPLLSSSLSPPPRRPRKKTVSSEDPPTPLSPMMMMSRIPELPPSRPADLALPSPRTKLYHDPYAERAIRSMSMSRSSSDNSVSSRRNSSSSNSSTCSSCSGPHRLPKRIECFNPNYSEAVTSHYFSAELPPVPNPTDEEEDFDCLVYRDLLDDDSSSINFNV